MNVAATIRESEWRQQKELELLAEAIRPAERLGLDAAARGPESEAAARWVRRVSGPDERAVADARTLLGPLTDAVAQLEEHLRSGEPFALALTERDLVALEEEALSYPTVHELRRGLVAFRRGVQHGIPEPKLSRLRSALLELELIDDQDRPKVTPPGHKLNPMESETLLSGLITRYRLRNLVHAYRHFDDEAFALSVVNLFGPAAPQAMSEAVVEKADTGTEPAVPLAQEAAPAGSS